MLKVMLGKLTKRESSTPSTANMSLTMPSLLLATAKKEVKNTSSSETLGPQTGVKKATLESLLQEMELQEFAVFSWIIPDQLLIEI